MSKKEYNISQEDVCIWFKSHLEGHSRIELMCSLIDICLPLELRFLGTYLEYAAGKHHAHLQKWEKDANNPASFLITDLSDAKTRRRICLFMTLLHSHNKTIATKLFDILSLYENLASFNQVSSSSSSLCSTKNEKTDPVVEQEKVVPTENTTQIDSTSCNEFKLLLTLSSLHPAFSFNQRRTIREKLEQFITLTDGNDKVTPCDERGEAVKEPVNELNDEQVSSEPPANHLPVVSVPENSSNTTSSVNTHSIPDHSNTSMENLQRQPCNQNQLFAEKNISKISPISIQVNRKKNPSINKHILSPGGSGQLSGECFESSPAISPAHSPRRSPYSSPSTSPMSHRKDHTNSKHIDAYSSASNWLKSLRLHKYSHKFEGYSFQMMKDLTDEGLSELISTKGAQSKFKQNIEHLVKQGFIEFSSPDNPSMNDDICLSGCNHVSSPSEGSPSNKIKNVSLSNDVQSFLLTPVLDSHNTHDYRTVHNFYNNEVNDVHKGKVQEVSPVIRPIGYFEDMTGRLISEPYIDDDTYEEVLTTRKQHMNLATCYNCGAKGHYGHQCIEETMEAQTYSRYAFQLDFSRRESFTNTEAKTDSGSITSR